VANRPPLKCYTFGGCYKDDPEESGPRTDIVLAPDRETAIRLAAVEVLSDNGWTLESQGYDTLTDFHDDEILINDEWVERSSPNACPNCTSSGVGHCAGGYVCNTCGYGFKSMGLTPRRQVLEEHAWAAIDSLDRFERLSKAGEPSLDDAKQAFDECQDRETAQTLLDTAELYYEDGIIECGTWEHYLELTQPFLKEEVRA
jgi:hypothetical protein